MFVNFNILNQLGSPAINSNTFANRPAAGQTGRLFVSTDTFELYRDNGTGWDLIGGPGSSTVTGSGAAGQVTYWTGASTIGGNNNLFWDTANSRLGIGTTTPGHKLQISGTGTLLSLNGGSDTYMLFAGNGADQYQIGYTDNAADYRRFSIYDSTGAKEVLTIDKQSRYVGINYQYSSLADQPAYTLDVSGSTRATDSSFFVTSGTGQVGINTTSPTATALVQANKTDGYGLYLNYTTNTGSGSTATALWALNTTAGSGYGAVIEEKTANTTGGQYPLLIKHSLSTGTAAAGMGTGLHFQLPDSAGTFKTTQLTVETTDAAAATYTTRYRFMAQVNGTSTALAYLTSVGLGIGNVIPSYKLDVNGTIRAFGAGNTGNYLAVDTNPGGATVQLNPQYGTGLPILQSVGSFPLLFGTNNTEVARFTTAGLFGIGTSTPTTNLSIKDKSTVSNSQFDIDGYSSTAKGHIGQFADNFYFSSNWFYNGSQNVDNNSLGISNITLTAGSGTSSQISFELADAGASNPSPKATLKSNGNFLIGTTIDAGQKLQVSGNSLITSTTPTLTINSTTTTGTTIGNKGNRILLQSNSVTVNNGGEIVFAGADTTTYRWGAITGAIQTNSGSGATGNISIATKTSTIDTTLTERLTVTSAGLVGIGTSTPTTTLMVASASGPNFQLQRTGFSGYTYIEDDGTNSIYRSLGATIFQTNGANERMRITSAGVVAIATTTNLGGGSLEVQTNGVSSFTSRSSSTTGANGGTTVVSVRSVDSSASYWANAQYNAWQQIFCASGSTEVMRLTSGTNVLIGTTTDAGYKLQVNGAISAKDNIRITATNTTSVSTSATTISNTNNTYGAMAIVWGNDVSGNIFTDMLFYSLSSVNVIYGQSVSGAPAARTYTMSSGNLQLAMGSGTYTIRYQSLMAEG